MITRDFAYSLAVRYQFRDADELLAALHVAEELYSLRAEQVSVRTRLRALKKLRKADPDDVDLWSEEFNLQRGARAVSFDARTREVTTAVRSDHRAARRRTQYGLNAVIAFLCSVWEQHRAEQIPVTVWLGPSESTSSGMGFIVEVLRAFGADLTPVAIHIRLKRRR